MEWGEWDGSTSVRASTISSPAVSIDADDHAVLLRTVACWWLHDLPWRTRIGARCLTSAWPRSLGRLVLQMRSTFAETADAAGLISEKQGDARRHVRA